MNMIPKNKHLISEFRTALYDCDAAHLKTQLRDFFAPDSEIHLTFPFGDLTGPGELFEGVYQPLLAAIPDVERRDFIVAAGETAQARWVGCAGHYMGVFEQPWLDIPPTRHVAAMRYHEFFRIEDEKIVEMQAIWDIPQLMLQADAWPMSPSLGVEWLVPGPATQDGLTIVSDPEQAAASVELVLNMLTDMGKHPLSGGPEVMNLEKYWHPKMIWYGPAGIGSMRRIHGFRNWHQIPFLKAMPDRRGAVTKADIFFGDGNYVGTTGWPNMQMTLNGSGWLGIAPPNKELTMCSLDFWRIENGLIRENWVLVDLLSIYNQIGVDVFARMREVTHARQPGKKNDKDNL
jgi:predicted ester cyclase